LRGRTVRASSPLPNATSSLLRVVEPVVVMCGMTAESSCFRL